MSDRISIRAVVNDDFYRWKTLWDFYNAFYGRVGATALPDEVTRTTWSRFFDADEPMHALVAEGPNTMLGFAHVLLHRSTTKIDPVTYLQDLFTVEAARGNGVGRSLVEAVYRYAAEVVLPHVYWQTHETNHVAMRLYDRVAEKTGFLVYRKSL